MALSVFSFFLSKSVICSIFRSVDGLVRALSICSTYTLLAKEFDEIRRICQLNDYPISFVDTCIGIGLTKHRNKNSGTKTLPDLDPAKRRMFVEIPFVGDKTESLKKQINRLTSNFRPDLDTSFCRQTTTICSNLFSKQRSGTNSSKIRHRARDQMCRLW